MGDSPDDDTPPWLDDGEDETKPTAAELEAAGQNSMFGDPAPTPAPPAPPVASAPTSNQPYRVLARKYRPQTFSQLIGQDAMVQTLGNAIRRDRLAHAFLMTGVRGVGKTSTARLIAKALNCIGPDGQGGPTIDPCGQCEPCVAIAEGRHIDVIEMDAASHTGVDDVREIIEAVRYAAVSARYKIYIIDEVHMLSRNAFNALLKTLEEPPAHVKFLFATTEVDKLPVTVLSRTQRFDLRRIPTELLQSHFAWVCAEEGVGAEDEALHMIAAAAEGSVRDGLSILDQAIAHADLDGGGLVSAAKVRDMLGLADKGAQRRLLGRVLEADAQGLMAALDEQYALGVEPLSLMRGLMDLVHRITLARVSGAEAQGASAEERAALADWASRLSMGQLHRLWQLLLKGYDEVRSAPDPLVSARMALLRIMHATNLPDPGSLVRRIEELAASGVAVAPAPASGESGKGATEASSATGGSLEWAALVDRVEQGGNHIAASTMRMQVRVVELAEGVLRFSRGSQFRDDIAPQIRDALLSATGMRWQVEECQTDGVPSLVEAEQLAREAADATMRQHPLVQAALETFPDAEFVTESAPSQTRQRAWGR
ncbi:MAG: DNA polymerase III subunit gamma/tau [Sphingomonadaceae bacterium]|nr:DNA polymerase III subunit gamma/tau [Sphingomonadaceae bacterium]